MIETKYITQYTCDVCHKEIIGTKYFTLDTDIYFDEMITVERGEYHCDCFLHTILTVLGKNGITLNQLNDMKDVSVSF